MSADQWLGLAIYAFGVVAVVVLASRHADEFADDDPDVLVGAVVLLIAASWPFVAVLLVLYGILSFFGRAIR